MPRKIFFQLFFSCMGIVLLSLAVASWHATAVVQSGFQGKWTEEQAHTLETLSPRAATLIGQEDVVGIQELCREMGGVTGSRLTVIRADGKVLGDTKEQPERMDNHAGRPEVAAALAGRRGVSLRYSSTMAERYLYIALPLDYAGRTVGVLRSAISVGMMDDALRQIKRRIIATGLVVALVAAGCCLLLARWISQPIQALRETCANFAAGRLDHQLALNTGGELDDLARNVNLLAGELKSRLDQLTARNREFEAILSSMNEGVIALDRQGCVISANRAAGRLLGHSRELKGRSFREVIRIPEMQQFVNSLLTRSTTDGIEQEFLLHDREKHCLQALGTALLDSSGGCIGALVMINDVTRIRHLENVRREFVANVSHEIKTPLTAIKGAVEALLDGAMRDKHDLPRFLAIINKHTDRLCAIIEDILSLSRIEQTADGGEMPLQEDFIAPALETACSLCQERAEAKNIQLLRRCPHDLKAWINGPLLEQAVMNLIDNAIKYSEEDARVEVEAAGGAGNVIIRVTDHGCGIPAENLPRLFERFYRVDKARSRKLGGTGLGLAIVKHIVQAHRGTVEASSVVGQGSVFTITLPGLEPSPSRLPPLPPPESPR